MQVSGIISVGHPNRKSGCGYAYEGYEGEEREKGNGKREDEVTGQAGKGRGT